MSVEDKLLGRASTPRSTLEPTRQPTSASTPPPAATSVAAPASVPTLKPKPPPAYPVFDDAGVIIDYSYTQTSGRRPEPRAREHAVGFLNYLTATSFAGHLVDASTLQDLYWENFCSLKELRPEPWNQVGKELRTLTGGKKTYHRRERVYRIPNRQADIVELETRRRA